MIHVLVTVDFSGGRGPAIESRRAFATERERDAFLAALERLRRKYPKAKTECTIIVDPESIPGMVDQEGGAP